MGDNGNMLIIAVPKIYTKNLMRAARFFTAAFFMSIGKGLLTEARGGTLPPCMGCNGLCNYFSV